MSVLLAGYSMHGYSAVTVPYISSLQHRVLPTVIPGAVRTDRTTVESAADPSIPPRGGEPHTLKMPFPGFACFVRLSPPRNNIPEPLKGSCFWADARDASIPPGEPSKVPRIKFPTYMMELQLRQIYEDVI
jgi:hypothetical protein